SAPHVFLNPFLFFDSTFLDVLVLNAFLPSSAVGVYYFAVQMANLVMLVGAVASTVLVPVLTTMTLLDRHDLQERLLKQILPHVVFVWSILLSVGLIVGHYIVPLILSDKLRPAWTPFSLLMASCSSAVIWQIAYHPIVTAKKWTWIHPCVQIPSGVV